ncbi:KAP family P-loop domain-containing protein [Candidatus Electrothrix communis]|uniref:KAP family P-loop domain-containing protein n=1 Tax=Candidatus Electrothrix communis TaxID=1859133 RepID=A0A3S3QV72_9BACT|nr:KAP family P-loop domain-containing protein [Candidatus Electrothrix communis]
MPENADSLIYSHNDEPVLETAFNEEFIARLCGIIRNCQPPKGLAVTGYWGSGKTSTLKQLYYHLTEELPPGCGKEDVPAGGPQHRDVALVPIWFEAWRFQHEQQPIVALLNEIRVKIGLLDKFMQQGKKIADITLLSSLNIFDEIIKMASGGTVTPKTGGIMAIGEKWEQDRYLNKLPSAQISGLLEEAIKKGLGNRVKGKEKRMIIFIDDLDRCLPTASLRLLEGIRIYLNLSNCILVFGMDHRQLEQSLLEALPWLDKEAGNAPIMPTSIWKKSVRIFINCLCRIRMKRRGTSRSCSISWTTAILNNRILFIHRFWIRFCKILIAFLPILARSRCW